MLPPDITGQNLYLYVQEMEIIKKRIDVINSLGISLKYDQTTTEFLALQIRTIVEHIMLASLVANAEQYKKIHSDFKKEWNVSTISKRIEAINPDFYPVPVIIESNDSADTLVMRENIISKEEIIALHGRMGNVLHADNPFSPPINCKEYQEMIITGGNKIIQQLKMHTIQLINQEYLLFIVLNDPTKNGNTSISIIHKTKVEV